MANPNGNPQNLIPLAKGVSGNPGGRPVAARTRLTAHFLNALADDFAKEGRKAIEACRAKRPDKYLGVIAALMPKQIEVTRPLDGLSDDELIAIADQLRSQIGIAEDRARNSNALIGEAAIEIPAVSEATGLPRSGPDIPGTAADGSEPGGEDPGGWERDSDAPDGSIPALVAGEAL